MQRKMKEVEVEITGISPLLMNCPKGMIDEMTTGVRKTTQKYDHEKDAEKLLYKTKKGDLFIPAEAIKGSMVGAASYKKFGKHSAKPIISGGVIIKPFEILLGKKDYEIDLRTVVIQRSRVVKARPRIDDWKVSFTLAYDETLIADGELIKPILEEAGKRVGLLDFRPQKLGNFGMFEVTKWIEKK